MIYLIISTFIRYKKTLYDCREYESKGGPPLKKSQELHLCNVD